MAKGEKLAVGEILEKKCKNGVSFKIPSYQRGYRWEKEHVIKLLDDIWEFYNGERKEEQIYCLQPLVVIKGEDLNWEVIDGQQRLTTLRIIMSQHKRVEELWPIEYVTRSGSKEFLNKIWEKDEKDAAENADFYYMYYVKEAVKKWFEACNWFGDEKGHTKDEEDIAKAEKDFLKFIEEKAKFIWYEVTDEEDAHDVFARLNTGKIRLTESELIKAMLLDGNRFGDNDEKILEQAKIAIEWDDMERNLLDEEFWLFINDERSDEQPTRIDYIFELIKENNALELKLKDEELKDTSISDYFEKKLKGDDSKDLKDCWKTVRRYYQILQEWYNDYELYHYMGFLITVWDNKVSEIAGTLREYDSIENKKEFVKALKSKIKDNIKSTNLDQVYETTSKPKKDCKNFLLLHNVQTVMCQNKALVESEKYGVPGFQRFPFHLYKKKKWDIEHIRPDNLKDADVKEKDMRTYVKIVGDMLPGEKRKVLISKLNERIKNAPRKKRGRPSNEEDREKEEAINNLLEGKKIKETKNLDNPGEILEFIYRETFDIIDDIFGPNQIEDSDKNKIWNYTLLDSTTNRTYGNHIFPFKRNFIINIENGKKVWPKENDKGEMTVVSEDDVAFVPICTRKVFSKSYTEHPDNLYTWDYKDAAAYRMDMEERLWEYLFDDIRRLLSINVNKGKKKNLFDLEEEKITKAEVCYRELFENYKKKNEPGSTTMYKYYESNKGEGEDIAEQYFPKKK